MPAKKTTNLINFQFDSLQRQITESGNVVRWYPNLAFDWMEDAKNRIGTDIQASLWNRVAKYMNDYVSSVEKMRYTDLGEFWGVYKGHREKNDLILKGHPRRLEYVEETFISLDEWMKYAK